MTITLDISQDIDGIMAAIEANKLSHHLVGWAGKPPRRRAKSAVLRLRMAVERPAPNVPVPLMVPLDRATLERPIAKGEISAWLQTPTPWVRGFAGLLSEYEPDPITPSAFLDLVREHAPDQMSEAIGGLSRGTVASLAFTECVREDVLKAFADQTTTLLKNRFSASLLPALATQWAEADLRIGLNEAEYLYAVAPDEALPLLIREILDRIETNNSAPLSIDGLPEDELRRVLAAVDRDPKLFAAAARRIAIAAHDRGAAANVLGSALTAEKSERNALLLRLLLAMGPEGRRAALEKGNPDAKAFLQSIPALPDLFASWDMGLFDLATQGVLELRGTQPTGEPPHAPISVELLATPKKWKAPHYADVLQLAAIPGAFADPEWAIAVATEQGWLGWGNDEGMMMSGLERVSARTQFPDNMPIGQVLAKANASARVTGYGIQIAEHFFGDVHEEYEKPLKRSKNTRSIPLHATRRSLGARNERERFPVVEAGREPIGRAFETNASLANVRVLASATDATWLSVTLREKVVVRWKKSTWRVEGLAEPAGGEAPPRENGVLRVGVEAVGKNMSITVGGAPVADERWPLEAEETAGTVRIETDGELTDVCVTTVAHPDFAAEVARLLTSDSTKTADTLRARFPGNDAAGALMIAATFGDTEEQRDAARGALAAMPGVEGWQDLARVEATSAPVAVAPPLRSFDEVAEYFAKVSKKKLKDFPDVVGGDRSLSPGKLETYSSKPVPGLYLFESPICMTSAKGLLEEVNVASLTCAWGQGGTGQYQGTDSEWFVLSLEFGDEDDDYDDPIFALVGAWKVREGLAILVLPGGLDAMVEVMGVATLPAEGWQDLGSIRYGE